MNNIIEFLIERLSEELQKRIREEFDEVLSLGDMDSDFLQSVSSEDAEVLKVYKEALLCERQLKKSIRYFSPKEGDEGILTFYDRHINVKISEVEFDSSFDSGVKIKFEENLEENRVTGWYDATWFLPMEYCHA